LQVAVAAASFDVSVPAPVLPPVFDALQSWLLPSLELGAPDVPPLFAAPVLLLAAPPLAFVPAPLPPLPALLPLSLDEPAELPEFVPPPDPPLVLAAMADVAKPIESAAIARVLIIGFSSRFVLPRENQ
jgi:hypothetical protein